MIRILHIDDDLFYTHTLKRVLEGVGHEVMYASHGEEGVRLAQDYAPDVILLDIAMPKKNGFETLEELQKYKTTKTIPVIMLTHLGAKEDVIKCLELGAASYLIKTHHSVTDIVRHVERVASADSSSTHSQSAQARKGFSLVELLLVLGVLLTALAIGLALHVTRTTKTERIQNAEDAGRYTTSVQ